MHNQAIVAEALALRGEGLGARRIARRLDLPVATVRDWLAGRVPNHSRSSDGGVAAKLCGRCGQDAHRFDELQSEYVYLFGLYLGDGNIASHPRGVYRLRITLDIRYPGIIESAKDAIHHIRNRNATAFRRRHQNCVDVSSYWRCWPCLLPQHGPGKKHERPIELTDWQIPLVERWPHDLLRGLIHSDGRRFQNTGTNWSSPRYRFDNVSADIRGIFCDACDRIGARWTTADRTVVYVSRKADVAKLDTFIGPKR